MPFLKSRDLALHCARIIEDKGGLDLMVYELPAGPAIFDYVVITTGRSNRAPKDVQPTLGNFPAMSEAVKARIPNVRLVRFANMGHSPQIQDPAAFHKALLEGLAKPSSLKPCVAAQARNSLGQAALGLPCVQCRLKP